MSQTITIPFYLTKSSFNRSLLALHKTKRFLPATPETEINFSLELSKEMAVDLGIVD